MLLDESLYSNFSRQQEQNYRRYDAYDARDIEIKDSLLLLFNESMLVERHSTIHSTHILESCILHPLGQIINHYRNLFHKSRNFDEFKQILEHYEFYTKKRDLLLLKIKEIQEQHEKKLQEQQKEEEKIQRMSRIVPMKQDPRQPQTHIKRSNKT